MSITKQIGLVSLGVYATLVCSTFAVAAEIYKIVDEDGNVIFTDIPPKENPKSYEIKASSSYAPPPTDISEDAESRRGANFGPTAEDLAVEEINYNSIDFAFPAEDQAIRENSGTVTFSLRIDPALQADHVVRFSVDGQVVQKAPATSFTVEHMDRGTHVVQAQILDGKGMVLASTNPLTFHLQRVSVLN
ncbi:MAG: DUF4124 domain-containing protein [Pseudomonadota bacterium]